MEVVVPSFCCAYIVSDQGAKHDADQSTDFFA